MAKAARARIVRKQTSQVRQLPPPFGGWNARDPLPDMPPEDAITLDNIIPGTGAASLRKGYTSHATGLGSFVESLMEYAPPSGTRKLFAAVPTAIYDVSSAAAVGAAAVSSLTNGRWQHCMFATSGGNYLVLANGADDVRNYDGSSWTTPSITNVTSANLISVTPHVSRLWFIEKDKIDPWYLPTASIAGAATKLTIGPFCRRGGYLLAIGSWSRDGGSGPDDLLVLVTSEGEVVIYSGTDPSSSSTFQQVGVFQIAKPIGRRCLVKAGSDLAVLTSVGIVPLSQVLSQSVSAQSRMAITDKISGAMRSAYTTSGTYFGWQVIEHPRNKILIVNVPIAERVTQHQYVMNTDTGAWCRFIGINAGAWAMFNDDLYFGDNSGTIWKYGANYVDNASTIAARVQQAFTDFGSPRKKRFVMAKPLFLGPEGYVPSVEIKCDYDISPATLPATTSATAGSEWDVAAWDSSDWDATSVPRGQWQTVMGIGQTGSIASTFTVSQQLVLNATDVMYEEGGVF